MKAVILTLLAFSLTSLGQPVEGPFEMMASDTNLKWPYVVRAEGSQVEIVYLQCATDSDRIRSAVYDFNSYSLSDSSTVISLSSIWSTKFLDVETAGNGHWIGALERHWGGPHREIHLILNDGGQTSSHYVDEANIWNYGSCIVVEWFQEFRVTTRPTGWAWSVGAGHTNPWECFPVVTPHIGVTTYGAMGPVRSVGDRCSSSIMYLTSAWGSSGSGIALMTSNSFFDNPGGTLLVHASDSVTWINPPIHLDSVLAAIDSRFNASEELLVVTGITASFASPAIVCVDSSGGCQARSSINWTGNPTNAAWNADFGFAVLRQTASELWLFRADTTGSGYIEDDLFYSSDSGQTIISSDVCVSSQGVVCVVWKENTTQAPFESKVKLLAVGWDTPLSTNPEPERTAVRHYELNAYPNPFNSELQIRYDLPRSEFMELSVCNVLGQQVAEMVNGMQSAGIHQAVWSPRVGSGIYFISLRTATETRTHKVLLSR